MEDSRRLHLRVWHMNALLYSVFLSLSSPLLSFSLSPCLLPLHMAMLHFLTAQWSQGGWSPTGQLSLKRELSQEWKEMLKISKVQSWKVLQHHFYHILLFKIDHWELAQHQWQWKQTPPLSHCRTCEMGEIIITIFRKAIYPQAERKG